MKEKNAIITYVDDKMLKNLERDFLNTLRKKAKYDGLIYVIYYGKNKKVAKKIEKEYGAKFVFAIPKISTPNQRNADIVKILDKIPKSVDTVMCIDGGDVWFQSPIDEIFDLVKNNFGFVEENQGAGESFNLDCINQIKNEKIRKSFWKFLKDYRLIGSGMIAGKRKNVMNILKKIAVLTKKINQDFFGLDQVVLNYVIRRYGKGISLSAKYDYSLISRPNQFEVIDGLFYDEKKELINIVHNSGSSYRFFPNGRKDVKPVPKFPKKLSRTFWGITTFFNPAGYKNKIKNYKIFRESSKKQGLNLLTVELTLGNNPFELKKGDSDILIRLRTNSILWQKERLLNIGLKNLPQNCDKFAWLDADIVFCNDEWVKETCHLLQFYNVIQPFSLSIRLPKKVHSINADKVSLCPKPDLEGCKSYGLAYRVSQLGKGVLNKESHIYGLSGFAWAARKDIFKKQGLFDKTILLGADLFIASSFYSNKEFNREVKYHLNNSLEKALLKWSKSIRKRVKDSVYYSEGVILHLWHGAIEERNYPLCRRILNKYEFDPEKDIKIDSKGCWAWNSNKSGLHKAVKDYFFLRNEDGKILKNNFSFFNFSLSKTIFLAKVEKIGRKIDFKLGQFGIFLNKRLPGLYRFILRTKFYSLLIKTRNFCVDYLKNH